MNLNLFEYNDYKKWVNDWISAQDKAGHGQMRKLAAFLKVNSVVMSQIFRGDRELTPEQSIGTAKFMGMSQLERDFFLLLVQHSRAGTSELRTIYQHQLESLRTSAGSLKNRVVHEKLSDEAKAEFYSQWYYSAIRLGLSIPSLGQVSKIADHLGISRAIAIKVVDFLIGHGLVVHKNGTYNLGPNVTHLGHDSPFVNRHHQNWRLKGMQTLEKQNEHNLFYTGPMTLSRKAAEEIRSELVRLVEKATKSAAKSDSEALCCLTLDWFEI